MKLLGAALLWVILLAVPQTAGAGSPVLHIRVNDRHVALPRPPDLEAGVLMAPLLPLLQAFGATVAWDPRSGVLDATTVSGRTLRLQAGVRQAGLGRESRVLPVPPRVEQGILLGPVAAVFRLVGAYVRLDEDTGVLDIVSQVTGVTWRQEGTRVVATVSTTGPVQARPTVLQAPDRLVVDLAGAVLLGTPPPVDVGGAVLRIRSAQFQVRPYVTRVVFDLARPLPYAIAGGAGAVTITLSDAEGAPAARPPVPGARRGGGGPRTPRAPAPPGIRRPARGLSRPGRRLRGSGRGPPRGHLGIPALQLPGARVRVSLPVGRRHPGRSLPAPEAGHRGGHRAGPEHRGVPAPAPPQHRPHPDPLPGEARLPRTRQRGRARGRRDAGGPGAVCGERARAGPPLGWPRARREPDAPAPPAFVGHHRPRPRGNGSRGHRPDRPPRG